MGTGAVTLADLVGRIDRLEVRCRCYDRYGRMRLAKLIAEHGDDLGLPELAVQLTRGCSLSRMVSCTTAACARASGPR
jgi:hypothetical protein